MSQQQPQSYEQTHLYRLRHSLAHVMAEAMLAEFPGTKIAFGPPIADGFYYDFDLPEPLTEERLKAVEKRMRKLVSQNLAFTRREVTPDEARALFAGQPYKLEAIEDLVNGRTDDNGNPVAAPAERITVYTQDTFTDLCRGPHVENTKEIDAKAFSITFRPPAGAYWRGDETRPQLTRVYGTAWETPEELQAYLAALEEAKRRDHRIIGEKLKLFTFTPLVGRGLPLWKPNGAILRDTLERWLRQVQLDNGYAPVVTPHIGNLNLYETSGHYPYYADSQYDPIEVDDEKYMLKPMNCPHHIMIYKSEPRSYRDLPVRYAEFGTVYRYEQSGELNGLTRVRGFTVDDAHLFVTQDQVLEEFIKVVQLIQYVFNTLGLTDFRARVGTRAADDSKYVGDADRWRAATDAIVQACEQLGLPYTVEEGEGAFYGPKLDLVVRDVLKREWQLGTAQVDYTLPERFDLEYVTPENSRARPVMIHRAPFGSMERFIGILIEHFNGAFPTWLHPVQVVVIPVADHHNEYAAQVVAHLKGLGLRVEADTGKGRIGGKIREAQGMKVPYMLVVGDEEVANGTVSVRLRDGQDLGAVTLQVIGEQIAEDVERKAL